MTCCNERGLTLVEVVLVAVIVVTGSTLAVVSMNSGLENREAKQASNALQSMAHAMKMYELEHGELPENLAELAEEGFLKEEELPFEDGKYTYQIKRNQGNERWSIQAVEYETKRVLSAENQSDGTIQLSDSRNIITPTPT
jgi:competence protein ComGC